MSPLEPRAYPRFSMHSTREPQAPHLHSTPDVRRHIRPFFLTPDGLRPTPYKPYYDIFSFLITQATFAFTTTPFMLLTLRASLLVWARVYFYAIIGAILSIAFFASPAKPYLIRKLKERNKGVALKKGEDKDENQKNNENGEHPVMGLGLPSDPAREVDEAVKEIREEVERGQSVSLPAGGHLKIAVEEKLGKTL